MKLSFRFVVITAGFIACLITANTLAVKVSSFGVAFLPAAVVVFPVSYILADMLIEVYGYKMARKVIWLAFACNLIFVFFVWVGQLLPSAPFWTDQRAYEAILGYTPRLLAGSVLGYLVGEFSNSFIMAKLKLRTQGRKLWLRTISSTIVGEGLDSAIFITIAYIGTPTFPVAIPYHWAFKTFFEVLATPLTYAAVNYLKRKEGIDTFDDKTNFNPFLVTR